MLIAICSEKRIKKQQSYKTITRNHASMATYRH